LSTANHSLSPSVLSALTRCIRWVLRELNVLPAAGGGSHVYMKLHGHWESRNGHLSRSVCLCFRLDTNSSDDMVDPNLGVHDGAVVQVLKLMRAYWFLLLPAALICRFVYYRYASPLKQYPGPLLASGSRAWKVWSTYNGKTENDHIELHERYGKPLLAVHSDA
jgi:hypothetical protein